MNEIRSTPQLTPIQSEQGFSLVELVVIIAVVGLLAQIAITQYAKYQSRARQMEAKIILGDAYILEKNTFALYGQYNPCLGDMGLTQSGSSTYYMVGIPLNHSMDWGSPFLNGCANGKGSYSDGTSSSYGSGDSFVPILANSSGVGGYACSTRSKVWCLPSTTFLNGETSQFIIGAGGQISSLNTLKDQWSIDQNMNLIHVTDAP